MSPFRIGTCAMLLLLLLSMPQVASGNDNYVQDQGNVTPPPVPPQSSVIFSPSTSLVTWAVSSLQNLSASGIYHTLSLSSVLTAEVTVGVYHTNTKLSLALQSPHFDSGDAVEVFEVVVMQPLADEESAGGIREESRSFAIDRFPSMAEGKVEMFDRERVVKRMERREAVMQEVLGQVKVEVEGRVESGWRGGGVVANMGSKELLHVIDTDGDPKVVAKARERLAVVYVKDSLEALGKEELARIVGDKSLDPLRRKVAERMLVEEQWREEL